MGICTCNSSSISGGIYAKMGGTESQKLGRMVSLHKGYSFYSFYISIDNKFQLLHQDVSEMGMLETKGLKIGSFWKMKNYRFFTKSCKSLSCMNQNTKMRIYLDQSTKNTKNANNQNVIEQFIGLTMLQLFFLVIEISSQFT